MSLDQPIVEVSGVGERLFDGGLGDLMEDHAMNGDLGLEHLDQMPGDGLTLAVLVSGEIELVGLLEKLL